MEKRQQRPLSNNEKWMISIIRSPLLNNECTIGIDRISTGIISIIPINIGSLNVCTYVVKMVYVVKSNLYSSRTMDTIIQCVKRNASHKGERKRPYCDQSNLVRP